MTGSLAPTIPTIGQPNSTEDADVKSSLETLRDGLNAILNSDNTVMGMQSYRTILESQQHFQEDLAAGTYGLERCSVAVNPQASGGANTQAWRIMPFFYFDDADYLITGKTLKLRLRAQIATNATKPTLKFTVGLYPITVAGGIDTIAMTLGAVVASSTVEINEPAASTITSVVGSDFAVPADGAYCLGVVTSGALTNNNYSILSAQLQVRNV